MFKFTFYSESNESDSITVVDDLICSFDISPFIKKGDVINEWFKVCKIEWEEV